MRRALRTGIGAVLAGATAAAWPGGAASAPDTCRATPARGEERTMNRLLAATRRAERVPRVRGNAKLLRAGRAKSLAMARGGRFAHAGSLPWARGRAGGQNIAMAPTARAAFRMMLTSPGHRANMHGREWRFAAVGAARGCSGHVYFTMNFMGPPVR